MADYHTKAHFKSLCRPFLLAKPPGAMRGDWGLTRRGVGGGGVRLREQEKLDVDCAVQLGAMAMGNCSLKAMQSIKLHVFCIAV